MCKSWLTMEPMYGMILPGESAPINLHCYVEEATAAAVRYVRWRWVGGQLQPDTSLNTLVLCAPRQPWAGDAAGHSDPEAGERRRLLCDSLWRVPAYCLLLHSWRVGAIHRSKEVL